MLNQRVRGENKRRDGDTDRYFLVSATCICINVPCREIWLLMSLFAERKGTLTFASSFGDDTMNNDLAFHLSETPAILKRGFLCANESNEPIVFLCFGEYSGDEL